MDDRPRGHEQDGRLAGAVDLVEDPDAVAFDEAGRIRVAGAALLARAGPVRPVAQAVISGMTVYEKLRKKRVSED